MKKFPQVIKPITPLYDSKSNSRPLINNNSSSQQLQQNPILVTFSYQSELKVIESKMYEPVSDRCVTGTTIINPRYSSSSACTGEGGGCTGGIFTSRTIYSEEEECNNVNGCSAAPPEKPPRRCKTSRQFKQELHDAGNHNTMKNGTGDNSSIDIDQINLDNSKRKFVDATVQTSHLIPYRLRFWPRINCDVKLSPSEKSCTVLRVQCCCRVLSQWLLSQFGLTIVVIIWALLGAYAFFKTEGPREYEQSNQLALIQKELAIELSTDLKQTTDHDDTWPDRIHKYLEKHETLLLEAVSAGFGEGGGGSIWTYPGCILFAVSLLTTLGFGAPVPRTTLGRCAAVLFSAIGIPLHFLLVLNMGNLGAVKLQQLTTNTSPKPRWLNWFPFLSILTYYLLGVILFGIVRNRDIADCFMFPLDFTAAGGVATVNGHVRILYALYLEVAVTLAALVLSLIQASASRGIVDLGLRLGILTNT